MGRKPSLEDAGEPLDTLVVSGNAGKELARVVKRDVWGAALAALEEAELVHADLHPGNVCIRERDGKLEALVVDLEGAVKEGSKLEESPIKYRDELLNESSNTASTKMDKAWVAAILQCLWEEGSFHDLVKGVRGLKNLSHAEFKERTEDILCKIVPSGRS
ncbi:expressed unknown protein [Seminavis robusta]|uniref:Protein kinase domain-containing protein n=1 Tax=Seminavis robusta TaxID=568900 RepID=A0A9N8DKJ8_9STRA|nr:expressed unknown protein [Seminavis robusta]|eukprot:Sro172_g076110.1 n/a (161) ;mRNA; r:95076-95558